MEETFTAPELNSEFVFKTSRSGGSGGQHVNKVSTRVQVAFHVPSSTLLTEEQKLVIQEKLGAQLTTDGTLQVVAQAERSQLANKTAAIKKIYQLLNRCFVVRKARKATKPTRSSVETRLQQKKRDSLLKQSRRRHTE